MARQPRQKSNSGIYHVVLRGINRQDIFHDANDYNRFVATLIGKKADSQFDLYAYCLMANHLHLLLRENAEGVSHIMSGIGTSYAWWYNRRYDRSGHVFQGRFGSECVEDDRYLLAVVRYIHNNPVKAKIVLSPEQYRWSSVHDYYDSRRYHESLVDTGFILAMMDENPANALKIFKDFMQLENADRCLEDDCRKRMTDEELRLEIEAMLNGRAISTLISMEKSELREILRNIKTIEGSTQRQISRVTAISPNRIFKA